MRIYFPMTCRILHVGHLSCLEQLSKIGDVVIGVLDEKALNGYKDEVVPFLQRYKILDTVAQAYPNVIAVRQSALNPEVNLKLYKCDAMASGDGWEDSEREAAKTLGIELIDIDSGYKIHSSDFIKGS